MSDQELKNRAETVVKKMALYLELLVDQAMNGMNDSEKERFSIYYFAALGTVLNVANEAVSESTEMDLTSKEYVNMMIDAVETAHREVYER